jgi:hypothetical protein
MAEKNLDGIFREAGGFAGKKDPLDLLLPLVRGFRKKIKPTAGAGPSAFGKVFDEARRKSGSNATFEHGGKKFSTRLKSSNQRIDDDSPVTPTRKKKPVNKNMSGMMNYSNGGKIRGHGMAKGGRPCKMVKMKGS